MINKVLWVIVLLYTCLSFNSCTSKDKLKYRNAFLNHYSTIIQSVRDNYGAEETSMWLASWNLKTKQYPFDFTRPDSIPCRVYLDRHVDAPGGASLYWNLPDINAAVHLARLSDNSSLEISAKKFAKEYLERCTSKNGIILWGNHYYYDVIQDQTVKFKSSETPQVVDFEKEEGDLHEIRPLLPPWELLYGWFPERIERHIRESAKMHIVDLETGEFNRHANQLSEYAFIEAGSILVNSLAFLYSKTKDENLLKMAQSIVEYSFSNRNFDTGLMINSPSRERWDQFSSTTEIGLWALNVLKASEYVPDDVKVHWIQTVEQALRPWLENGFDEKQGKFYGSLNVNNAEPIEKKDDYPYKPETYADIWNPLFPTHNYPLQFAESCLRLYELNGKQIYKEASNKWLKSIKNQLNSDYSKAKYAENYARIIHFLNHYGKLFNDSWAKERSNELAVEALSNLYVHSNQMFRGHTNEMRYDCVDGIGLLFFAMSELEVGAASSEANTFF